ncbi:MAG: MFS transporter, partial [Variovorax sp.]
MGTGAIIAVLYLPRLRQGYERDQLVLRGTMVQSVATAVMAVAPNVWVAVPAMMFGGAAWITVANSLSVSAQLALPDWVRARGMSTYQMAIMGSTAIGAALWGQIATIGTLRTSLYIAAVSGTLLMLLALRHVRDHGTDDDVSPAQAGWSTAPAHKVPDDGRIVINVEYLIDPARAASFHLVMHQTRRTRLSEGAIGWELLHDITQPERYVEQIVDASWTEHLRRFNRATAADLALRERRLAFHMGEDPPVVTRYVVQR